MADFYYRYKNGGDNMILNDAYLSLPNPVTSGLHRRFRAEDFNTTTRLWTDSALGQNITTSVNVTLVSHTGDKQYRTTNAVQFSSTGSVSFNNDVLTSYTLFAITRYTGPTNRRVIEGIGPNWLSGHWDGKAGVAYHEGWLNETDVHQNNFFIGTDVASTYSTNGIVRGTATPGYTGLPKLAINAGQYSNESSDCQLLDILMYNRVLSDLEKKKVEQYLASYYGLLDTVGSLTARYNRTPLATETSLLVSNADNYITYPSFYIAQTGLTFAMWFKSNTIGEWTRLFDFSNGAAAYNIIAAIKGGNLAISVQNLVGTVNTKAEFWNVFPNCNDNVWRHFIWTISADGLTWKVYINRVLQATITAATGSNYSSYGTVGPYHPESVLRTLNYLGKSNWGDPLLIGSIDEFRMFNSEIGPQAINFPWFMNVTSPISPLYNRPKLSTETALLVSNLDNYITYPSFYIAQTGLTFAMWFKANGTGNTSRLFDFGNGQLNYNIFACIINNNLSIFVVKNDGTYLGQRNVFSSCNDNVWRHFVWTISSDGVTWKVYINRVLQATITASTISNYNLEGTLTPFHPESVMRTSNYLGKSNWNADPLYKGSIDDFQMYNYPMDQYAINNTWTIDTGGSLLPKYLRERLVTETSMLVSTPTNRNYLIYPSFNIAQTGLTFAFWFKAGTNSNFARLFDFGNGVAKDNIIAEIFGNDLGLAVFNGNGDTSGGSNFQVLNAYSGITDSVWRHLVWTISADGLTYQIYINKVLQSTITASTITNYSKANALPPFHPTVGLRSVNLFFNSNDPGDTYSLNASMHAFQLWNRPLVQSEINNIYTSFDSTKGTYTLSQFSDIQKLYGTSPFVLSNPVSTGTGTFTFTSSNTSVATIEDNVVTIVGIGTTTITALQWTETITATLTVIQPVYSTPVLTNNSNTNFLVTIRENVYDINETILRNTQQTVNLKNGFQSIGFGSTVNVYKKNITCTMNGISQVGDTQISFGKSKKNMWVSVGQGAYPIGYSYDGIEWKGITSSLEGIGIAYNGTLWVVVGRGWGGYDLTISYDGINWTEKSSGLITSDNWFSDIVWNGKMFVAALVIGTKALAYSYDGMKWTVCGGSVATFNGYGNNIAWNGRLWIGCGAGTYQLGYSFDGINWNPSTSSVFSGGSAFSAAWNGTLWIAVGNGTHHLASSSDGVNWTGLGKGPMDTYISGIAWNGKVWVIVGYGGLHSMAYSYDGFIWNGVGLTALSIGRRVSWNGTMFLAVGSGANPMAYSYDGINWTSIGNPFYALRHSVANNNTLENQIVVKQRTYVETGSGINSLAYSYDGFTWKGMGKSIFDSYSSQVAYNGKLWVAVGYQTNTIAYSYDGITWVGIGKTAINGWGNCIAYNGTLWLAGGYSDNGYYQIASSTTGTSFTGVASPFGNSCMGVAWNGTLWVAVGYWNQTIAWSTNGTSWTMVSNPPLSFYGLGVTWNGKLFVACGEGTNSLCWSLDGKTWTAGTTLAGDNTTLLSGCFVNAKWNGKLWIAIGGSIGAGGSGSIGTFGSGNIAYSYDGKSWTKVNNLSITNGRNILWDGKKWIAGTTSGQYYSYDGFTWSTLGTMITYATCIAYDSLEPDTYIYMSQPSIALGKTDPKSIVYSLDGFTWTQAITPRLSEGFCAAHNGSIWVAGGLGPYTMVYSSDGITWNPVLSSKTIFSDNVHGIVYNGTLWVAGGAGTNALAYSYDGLSWTPVSSIPVSNTITQVYGIAWNGTMFVAAVSGTSALAYSYDGKTWTYASSPLGSGYAIASSDKMWIASGLGTNDTMAYSYDGKSWTGLGKGVFGFSSNAIAHNGFMWVAGGASSNTLAYSYDGFSWTGLGTSIFASFGYGISWNGNKWIATGSGTNSIAYSVDGKNWVGLGTTNLDMGFGAVAKNDYKITTDTLSFNTETYQNGYKNLAIGVKGTLY
jgi:hypothetical protein